MCNEINNYRLPAVRGTGPLLVVVIRGAVAAVHSNAIPLKLYYHLDLSFVDNFCSKHLLGCHCHPDYVCYLV